MKLFYPCTSLHLDRARALADLIGGDAIPLRQLVTYHPKEGTVLANTTSVGLDPNTNETPISKVCLGFLTI